MTARRNPALLLADELPHGAPERLALVIARIAYPDLDMDRYLLQLDEMTAVAAPRVANATEGVTRAQALIEAMRDDLGLRGNTERYYDAANSYLNVVMERRTGLPIMLSLLLVAVGGRLGLNVEGIGFPGHFMVRYEDEVGVWFLDPFHGNVVTADEVPDYFVKLFDSSGMKVDANHYEPMSPAAWALRILNNLRAVYISAGDLSMIAKVLPLMLVLEPARQELWQELGLIEYRRGELMAAARALRRYFFLLGHLVLSTPNSPVPHIRPNLNEADLQIWNLLEEIESASSRWN